MSYENIRKANENQEQTLIQNCCKDSPISTTYIWFNREYSLKESKKRVLKEVW